MQVKEAAGRVVMEKDELAETNSALTQWRQQQQQVGGA